MPVAGESGGDLAEVPYRRRKIAVMGYRAVGKSSITLKFTENRFPEDYDPTIENIHTYTFEVDGAKYSVDLIDTAGQDEFTDMPQSYFLNIDGYVLVYSVDSQKSVNVCVAVHEQLLDKTGRQSLPIVLCGNKCDLKDSRCVSSSEGQRIAKQLKAVWVETSAKDADVSDVFVKLVKEIDRANGFTAPPDNQKKDLCSIC